MAETVGENRSLTTLVSDLSRDVSTLFRKEIHLARAEASEKVNQAVVASGAIVIGLIFALAALMVLLDALVVGLTNAGLPEAWSALIVGVVVAIIAFVMVQKGINDLKASNLTPERTVNAVKRDTHALKEQAR